LADVALDPVPYGGGSSCYDIFSRDFPLVTLPGAFNAGRYALACYRRMGMLDLVADSPEHYAEIAARLGTDRAHREGIVARLSVATSVLFENVEVVRAFEAYFEDAIAASWPSAASQA
jgi:predicted O-linked N-acetylglucosamine transferase (SPINDLY family)